MSVAVSAEPRNWAGAVPVTVLLFAPVVVPRTCSEIEQETPAIALSAVML
ncbi:MAG: hypothetical protein IPJ28_18470 [Betaproteobacteria bacterium]|nr:hypothetical protein [Betaproteobacteria bacterium]